MSSAWTSSAGVSNEISADPSAASFARCAAGIIAQLRTKSNTSEQGGDNRTGRSTDPHRRSGASMEAARRAAAYGQSMVAAARLPLSPGARRQIGLFLLAYLVYSAARWLMVGDLATAQDHAQWIVGVEQDLGVASEASVQHALSGTWILWLLNHAYIAAQLVVVPGALIFLYHRSRPVYHRLRNTILATWLISVPVYALFPVAPPRLAVMGLVDTISNQT